VDDIVLTGNSAAEMDKIKHILHSNIRKDLGALNYFLGLEINQLLMAYVYHNVNAVLSYLLILE